MDQLAIHTCTELNQYKYLTSSRPNCLYIQRCLAREKITHTQSARPDELAVIRDNFLKCGPELLDVVVNT